MTTMIREVYEALKEAGATEEKAAAAAEAIEEVRETERLHRIEERLRTIEERLTRMEGRFTLLQWMLGFLLALGVANLWLLIRLAIGGAGG
jgi:hypothetical protein